MPIFPCSTRAAASFVALCLISPLAFAGGPKNSKLSSDLNLSGATGNLPVIVQYRVAPSSTELNKLTAAGWITGNFASIHAVGAQVPQSALGDLVSNSNVVYVSPDRAVAAKQVSTTSAEYTTEPINAPAVWAKGYRGTGIGVAVIDSGVNPVRDLSLLAGLGTRIVYNESFVPGELTDATDHFGHGTHVAGLIAGNGTASTGVQYFRTFAGSAPNANIINLRVLDEHGMGSDSAVIAAIERAIALKSVYNIKVINLSVGRPVFESFTQDPLCQAVEQAWNAGIVVVVAAGNDGRDQALNPEGYGTIEAPGNDPYALTVGAIKTLATAKITDDEMASYSSKGPTFVDHIAKPDLVAPGNVVTSLLFAKDSIAAENPAFVTLDSFYMLYATPQKASTDYFPLSGTSMASGVVSGAVADLLQAVPGMTPDQAKAFLMRTANRTYLPATSVATDPTSGMQYTAHNDLLTVGAGYLDIAAAVTAAQANASALPTGTAMSPVAAYDPKQNQVYLLKFPGSLWGTTSGGTVSNPLLGGLLSGLLGVTQTTPVLTWNPIDVYGANAVGSATPLPGAVWGWTPLYGATNVTGQPVVAATVPASALWGSEAIAIPSDSSAFTELWGNGTPLWGTGTPLWGTGSPISSTGTPLWGTGTPLWGTTTPLWGTGTAVSSTGTPLWGTGTPLWGTGTPLWGTSTPLWGTSTPSANDALWGASTTDGTSTSWGASSLQSSHTPLWGTSLPLEK